MPNQHILAFTCKKEDKDKNKCISYSKSPVTAVTGANTGSINEDINLTISFTCFTGCGQFSRFD
jgi:hypothetical protein